MPWHATLQIDYSKQDGRSVARFQHQGPLRILQSLYPEGDAICHNVLVHPPGGLVGGDTLDMQINLAAGSHALITTPGASRFYRSSGELASQRLVAHVAQGARLEWLPLEAIAYSGCQALNQMQFSLQPGAEMLGWDVLALGLPQAQQTFAAGNVRQHLEIPGVWLERGRIDADDKLLLHSPLGLAGHNCMATLFFAAGAALNDVRRGALLDLARTQIAQHDLHATAGATAPNPQVVVVRVLAPLVEPAMDLLRRVWAVWRSELWRLPATQPRIWAL